jgi:hypothetical protein
MKNLLFLFIFLMTSMVSAQLNWKDAVGVSSDAHVVGSQTPSLSWLRRLDTKASLQFYLLVITVDPMAFGLGGNYKKTFIGKQSSGVHWGAGLGIAKAAAGTSTLFNINGIIGYHMQLKKDLFFNLDAGPTATVGGGNFQMTIGGHSALLGISLLYIL